MLRKLLAIILPILWLGLLAAPAQAQQWLPGGIGAPIVCAYNGSQPTVGDHSFIYAQCDTNGNIITTSGGGSAGSAVFPSGGVSGSSAGIGSADANAFTTTLSGPTIAAWAVPSTCTLPAGYGSYALWQCLLTIANSPALVTNQPVGTGGYTTGQINVTNSATLIVAALTGAIGTGRVCVTITNLGTTLVFLGGAGVTTTTGEPLPGVQWASVTRCTTAAIYGISSGSTQTVAYGYTF